MALRIEIVGHGPRAQSMIAQLLALKAFEITTTSPPAGDEASAYRDHGAASLHLHGKQDRFAMLHENSTTGEVEGTPVVTIRAREENDHGVIWE